MGSSLFTVEGMFHGRHALTVEHLLDHVALDSAGRLVVSMVDVLAMGRIDAGAELLLVQGHDGTSRALRLPDVVRRDDVFLHLHLSDGPGSDYTPWIARLWSPDEGPTSPVASIHAMSFASFVGKS
jgi:hypothetical protein